MVENTPMSNVLTINLAGGEGSRFKPLIAVWKNTVFPYEGDCKINDFVFCNFGTFELLENLGRFSSSQNHLCKGNTR